MTQFYTTNAQFLKYYENNFRNAKRVYTLTTNTLNSLNTELCELKSIVFPCDKIVRSIRSKSDKVLIQRRKVHNSMQKYVSAQNILRDARKLYAKP